jgi:hypothetical protein
MPRETYLKAAKDLWPHLETKMANWMTQADKQDPTKVDRGEFEKFRTYIHKVTEWGCVVDYKNFASYESKTDGTPDNYKGQFEKNQACNNNKAQASCVAPCVWQGEKPAETFNCLNAKTIATCPTDKCQWQTSTNKCDNKATTAPLPACPTFEGAKINDCPTDRGIKQGTACTPKPATQPAFDCTKLNTAASCPADKCHWQPAAKKTAQADIFTGKVADISKGSWNLRHDHWTGD